MRRAVTLIIIFLASSVVALVLAPAGDPYTYCMNLALVLCMAIPCYLVGLYHGRTHERPRDPLGTPAEANPRTDHRRLWFRFVVGLGYTAVMAYFFSICTHCTFPFAFATVLGIFVIYGGSVYGG